MEGGGGGGGSWGLLTRKFLKKGIRGEVQSGAFLDTTCHTGHIVSLDRGCLLSCTLTSPRLNDFSDIQ